MGHEPVDEATEVLLGVRGFRVLRAVERDEDELERGGLRSGVTAWVETIHPRRGCPDCGVVGEVKERPVVKLQHATLAGRRCQLRWVKRRWVCRERDCPRKSWTEQDDQVGAGRRTTRACRRQVADAVERGHSVDDAAGEVGVGWATGWRAVLEEAKVPDAHRPVTRLGIDETVARRGRRFVTHLVDLSDGTVIRTVEGRSKSALRVALWLQGRAWRAGVIEVAIDPFAPYAAAVREMLPNATLVVDKFHVLRLFAAAVDAVRRRTVAEAEGRRGRKVDRLWRSRMLLLKRFGNLTPAQEKRLFEALAAEDTWGEVGAAYRCYQDALEVFDRKGTAGLWSSLNELLTELVDADVPELTSLAKTLSKWMPEIWNYFVTGTTNAATEGCNRKVKQVKRVGCGYRNPANYRRRVALHAGTKHYRRRRRQIRPSPRPNA